MPHILSSPTISSPSCPRLTASAPHPISGHLHSLLPLLAVMLLDSITDLHPPTMQQKESLAVTPSRPLAHPLSMYVLLSSPVDENLIALRIQNRSEIGSELDNASVYMRQWALAHWAEGTTVDLAADLLAVKNEIRTQHVST
ncbi:hypothetical protein B0H14DRAFT_3500871 [Mycena olivaceomarginata]|nr:hypothetical protein B0H14DRAFT_3500871 [Mycena olivaceomarginata]